MQTNAFNTKNFQMISYEETTKILSQNFRLKNLPNGKTIFLCVGAHGSGKSTFLANLYKQKLLTLPYLNKKAFQSHFAKNTDVDLQQKCTLATNKIAENMVKSGHSFCWETEDQAATYFPLIEKAKKQGYHIGVVFVQIAHAKTNLQRVDQRAEKGGANCHPLEILESIDWAKKQAIKLIEICDEFFIFDNSKDLVQTKGKDMEKNGRNFCL